MLRSEPLKITAGLKAGVVQFRHPWVDDKVLRFGVAKLVPGDRTDFLSEVQKLLDRAPRIEAETPASVRTFIVKRYFDAIREAEGPLTSFEIGPDGTVTNLTEIQRDLLSDDRDKWIVEKARMQAQIENLVRASGERTEAEQRTNIQACWEQFEKFFQCKNGTKIEERRNVLRRVKCVLEKLGWEKRHSEITMADINAAIDKTEFKAQAERSKRAVDTKRFFKFLCKSKVENGLGFMNNPAANLEYLSPTKLQKMRRAQGKIKIADAPEEILPKLPLYYRALYAMLSYAGLRLGETAALTWDRIDFEKRIITVLPSAAYNELKSDLSERPVKPFKELWPILEEFRQNRLNESLVFPRPASPDKTWFLVVLGEAKVDHLSRELTKALKQVGLDDDKAKEPARRTRRYWETRMRSIGRTDLIQLMGGHTEKVGRDHYTDALQVVEKVSGDFF